MLFVVCCLLSFRKIGPQSCHPVRIPHKPLPQFTSTIHFHNSLPPYFPTILSIPPLGARGLSHNLVNSPLLEGCPQGGVLFFFKGSYSQIFFRTQMTLILLIFADFMGLWVVGCKLWVVCCWLSVFCCHFANYFPKLDLL